LTPTIARSERALWRLYLVDPEYGSLGYAGFHDWAILEGRYTLAVLFEYAATLGLIDVEYVQPVGARDDYHDNWGADHLDQLSRYDGLTAIRVNALGAYALGMRDGYEPPVVAAEQVFKVLPNLDVVVTGQLSGVDRLFLDGCATQSSERVWTLSMGSLLAAVETGRALDQVREFLADRAQHDLPDTVVTLLADSERRIGQVRDRGVVRLIECVDESTAVLIARDRKLAKFCQRVGDRHLAVPVSDEDGFRKALRTLGYVLPT
jgi:hypothetical protein